MWVFNHLPVQGTHQRETPVARRGVPLPSIVDVSIQSLTCTRYTSKRNTCREEGCTTTFNSRCEYSVTYLYKVHIKENLIYPEEGCTASFNSRCEYSVNYLYAVHIKENLTCPEEGCTATFNRCEYAVHIKENLTCPEEGCTAAFNRCEYSVATSLYTPFNIKNLKAKQTMTFSYFIEQRPKTTRHSDWLTWSVINTAVSRNLFLFVCLFIADSPRRFWFWLYVFMFHLVLTCYQFKIWTLNGAEVNVHILSDFFFKLRS